MEFVQAVTAYQRAGDRHIINSILEDVETDFLANTSRRYKTNFTHDISINLTSPEEYIAYRIKAIREKAVKRVFYIRKDSGWAHSEINRYLSIMVLDLRMRIPFKPVRHNDFGYEYTLTPEFTAWLREKNGRIERRFREEGFGSSFTQYQRALDVADRTEREAVIEETRIRAEVMADMVGALEYALKYVDVSRSPREIVTYVNKALLTRYYEAQARRKGMRRVTVDGRRQMIAPFYEGAIRTILGVNSTEDYVYKRVTDKQADFLRELIGIVETDMAAEDCAAYHVLPDGEYRLSRKYAAEKTGLSYTTVKMRLLRIRKLITERVA
ncbi:hypothetical protein [Paenibacillus odorifer]|uniref:hypothetical protein n=1 Tax=Paenibacillus TaxID=44249 RepID=UPI00096C4CD9|nr:hypothetical protein [Paenibacillus odorifer]OMC97769.1 hypothetical protein BJP46_25080 [Paenibacillus odorifer]